MTAAQRSLIKEAAGIQAPAIIINADTDPARIRQAVESGCTLMYKPIDPAKLKEAMPQTLAENGQDRVAQKQVVKVSP